MVPRGGLNPHDPDVAPWILHRALPNSWNWNKLATTQSATSSLLKQETTLKTRSIILTLMVCLLALTFSFAEDANMGTWKLNESKSKLVDGMIKNTTVTYAAEGDSVKVTTDGTGSDGQPMQTEWTGKFDGKDYPRRPDLRRTVVYQS